MPPHESILSDGMHRRDDGPAARWPVAAVALLGVAAVVIGIFATSGAGEVEQQRDSAAQQAQDLGSQVIAACARGDVVQSVDGRDLCQRAAQVSSEPVPGVVGIPGEPGAQGVPGRPPTPEEIQSAVTVYCAEHADCAGRAPTTAEVAAAVAEYLIANPPQPGRAPTAAEIAAAVSTYFANNPPPEGPRGATGARGETGAPGPTGAPGRPPTDEEIAAAVDAWLADNPVPTCPSGSTLSPVEFADDQTGWGCVTGSTAPDPDPTTEPTTEPPPTTEMTDGG
jgi:hypothetical protein